MYKSEQSMVCNMKEVRGLSIFLVILMTVTSIFPALLSSIGAAPMSSHSPISINGNAAFTAGNGVVAGTGTEADPYIFENYTINASTAHGIRIQNTDKPFIIRNCSIVDGNYGGNNYYGIYLTDAQNGDIENCTFTSNRYHIYLSNSDNTTIANNTMTKSTSSAIYIVDGDDEWIADNQIHDNNGAGLMAISGFNNGIIHNAIYKNSGGIDTYFSWSKYYDNDIHNNSWSAMDFKGDRNTVRNNTMKGNNQRGMRLWDASWNTIAGNNISDNKNYGIMVDRATNNTVRDNVISNNQGTGVAFSLSPTNNNTLVNNTFSKNPTDGINVRGNDNKFLNNTFTDGDDLYGATVYRCQFVGNTISGKNLRLQGSTGALVSNNTISGGRIDLQATTGAIVSHNKIDGGTTGISAGCADCQIFENTLLDSKGNALTVSGSGNEVHNNTIDGFTSYGLYLSQGGNRASNNTILNGTNQLPLAQAIRISTDNNVVDNNTIRGNDQGIYLVGDQNIIDNNTISDSNSYGIWISTALDNVVHDNTLYNNSYGIYTQDNGNRNIILRNDIYSNRNDGIQVRSPLGLTIKGNRIHENIVGIRVQQVSSAVKIDGNIISDNTKTGILFYRSDNHFVYNNTVIGNPVGISLNDSDTVYLYNNSVYDSNVAGILLERAQNDRIYNDFIVNCSVGLNLTNSNFTSVYNNYINNSVNYKVSGGTGNQWDTTYTLGTNIIDGPYLGGNYWSDYTGTDSDLDWIGDTMLPYGPGDNLPLVQPPDPIAPGLVDRISWDPTTGDPFLFKASAWDNINLRDVVVRYRFDQSGQVNQSMSLVSGDMRNGTFTYSVVASSHSFDLYYNMTTEDIYGNMNYTGWKKLQVVDNDPPILADNTVTLPTTGDNLTVNATATDNINVSNVRLDYQFGQSAWAFRSLNISGGNYLGNLSVPTDAKVLKYKISASDNSSNGVALPMVQLQVRDNDLPVIKDLSGADPTTGQPFNLSAKVTDNLNVSNVKATYWFGGDAPTVIGMDPQNQDGFTLSIDVPLIASLLHYNISASDPTNNQAVVPTVGLSVQDTIPPAIEDTTGTPQTGKVLTIACKVTENIAVAKADVEYWFDTGVHTNRTLFPTYSTVISVPTDAQVLHYNITVKDLSNNTDNVMRTVAVLDTILPAITDLTSVPTTGDDLTFSFNITDNWGPKAMTVEYWFDGGTHAKTDLSQTVKVQVPYNATRMSYNVSVNDTTGNMAKLHIDRKVLDNDRPVLKDLSGSPSTGETFVFNFTYSDNTGVTAAFLEYRFDTGSNVNISYTGPISIKVPDTAMRLNYTMKVLDRDGNFALISRDMAIPDTESPVITDLTVAIVHTGDALQFQAYVWDNIAVGDVSLTYWFDGQTRTTKSLTVVQESYTYDIMVPVDAKTLDYLMTAKDSSGNVGTLNKTVKVRDSILPTITDHTGNATTGDILTFKADFSDNIGVTLVTLDYWFNDGTITTVPFVDGMNLQVLADAQRMSYIIHAKDAAGNERKHRADKLVKDNDPPAVTDLTSGKPAGDKDFTVRVSATDNIAMSEVSLTYWFNGQTDRRTVAMSKDGASYSAILRMGPKGELHYIVKASDTSNNAVEGQETILSIKAAGKAPISGTLVVALVLVIVVVVIVVVVLVIKRMSRIGPKESIVEAPVRKVSHSKTQTKGSQGPKEVAEAPTKSEQRPSKEHVEGPSDEGQTERPKTKASSKAWASEPKSTGTPDKASTDKAWEPKKDADDGPDDKKKPPKDILDEILDS